MFLDILLYKIGILTKAVGEILVIHFFSIKYNYINEAVFIKVILLKGAKSFHSLFRGITCSVFPYLPPVPRLAVRHIALPQIALRLSGVIKISPLRGEA